MVEAACCQSAEIWEGGDWTTTSDCLHYCNIVAVQQQMILWQYITQIIALSSSTHFIAKEVFKQNFRAANALYKTALCGTFCQLPSTWTWCEVTATERDTSWDRSVVDSTSRQRLHVAGRLSTSVLTDVRGGVAMRKSVKHSFFFVNNFQTVSVVYGRIVMT